MNTILDIFKALRCAWRAANSKYYEVRHHQKRVRRWSETLPF